MNILQDSAGCATDKHFLETGWKVDRSEDFSDMGQGTYTMTDYSKDDKLFLTGGYWTWYIKDKNGKLLWEGWWNSNDEFDETIKQLEYEQTTSP